MSCECHERGGVCTAPRPERGARRAAVSWAQERERERGRREQAPRRERTELATECTERQVGACVLFTYILAHCFVLYFLLAYLITC